MRVLQLIDSLDAGGAERMAVNIANVLSESVERSYLCATRREGLLKDAIASNVSYLFLDKQRKLDWPAMIKLRRYILKEKIDIIHAHSTSFFMATLMKWLIPGLKIVWHDHYGNSSYLEERKYGVLKLCSRSFSLILSVNSVLETWAKTNLNGDEVAYLPNFAIQETVISQVTELKGVAGKRILCLANLREQKDHHNLLQAFKLVGNHHSDWTLHCVGQDFKDAYSESVYQLVTELDLEEQVFFYGSCPDSSAIIKQADIGVLSSSSEGLPLALLEYGLGQLPIVATNVGDSTSVLPEACREFLVAPNHPEHLAERIMVLISDDYLRETTGKVINQHVLEHFSAMAVNDKLMSYYSQL
ncbi:glycosyltransferase [Gelidibacter gilvus]|uniref:Glycosyltransferase n=1 Tax=Gelidibacter gilvus TaxID=59602 RepID=A0A4Q0XFC0_9FLAO|nr:glycosyltransferase [Gelidibacter gilvus]RXJ45416.1 glycosyltransferase [Gelidibacter gilvus]